MEKANIELRITETVQKAKEEYPPAPPGEPAIPLPPGEPTPSLAGETTQTPSETPQGVSETTQRGKVQVMSSREEDSNEENVMVNRWAGINISFNFKLEHSKLLV